MDIIVTTPKTEMQNSASEAEFCKKQGGGFYHRSFSKLPKIREGEKVFYVEDGFIRGFAEVFWTQKASEGVDFICQVTKRKFSGGGIVTMNAVSWKWIEPIPYKGFQGFRYAKDLNYKIVGDWLAPRPALINA
jgi:hypothetical protein